MPLSGPKVVEFHFDFGSPNAYFAHKVLPGIVARTGASIRYVPVLLGGIFKATNNRSPFEAFSGVKNKLAYERLEIARFIAKHKLDRFTMNPFFPVNTLLLMRGAVAMEKEGRLAPYVEAGFHHMWEEPKKMDDPAVFKAALDASGFDGAAILEATQAADVKAGLMANTEASVGRGSFGAPTFFVGREIFFGKDRLRDVEDALAA
ncbi:2-hydroxychromene-2-carboxylate isomerase [Phreatobacter oligotrophus]|uniref:2-hydroxychromene-2-carboxylate isomerase n=1 Tax=Phreatobacter oligotrophus TaxID=1122261 RepID=UPI002357A018|nr:2-hydroxychromene-2-carboxylate isomerase [Phreatobacter oligotrophus]MBX9989862.1 2-hydroxychromene-2-carboxylate isomerase [Phreatobacter oligotrophus]